MPVHSTSMPVLFGVASASSNALCFQNFGPITCFSDRLIARHVEHIAPPVFRASYIPCLAASTSRIRSSNMFFIVPLFVVFAMKGFRSRIVAFIINTTLLLDMIVSIIFSILVVFYG